MTRDIICICYLTLILKRLLKGNSKAYKNKMGKINKIRKGLKELSIEDLVTLVTLIEKEIMKRRRIRL